MTRRRDFELERSLDRFPAASLLLAGTLGPASIRAAVERYAFHVKARPGLLDGEDLVALGVERGPELGALLEHVRERQLDGGLKTREEALEYVRAEWTREHRPDPMRSESELRPRERGPEA